MSWGCCCGWSKRHVECGWEWYLQSSTWGWSRSSSFLQPLSVLEPSKRENKAPKGFGSFPPGWNLEFQAQTRPWGSGMRKGPRGSSLMHGWRGTTGMIYWQGWEINEGADGGVNEWKGWMDGQRDSGDNVVMDGCTSTQMRTNVLTCPHSLSCPGPVMVPTEESSWSLSLSPPHGPCHPSGAPLLSPKMIPLPL